MRAGASRLTRMHHPESPRAAPATGSEPLHGCTGGSCATRGDALVVPLTETYMQTTH